MLSEKISEKTAHAALNAYAEHRNRSLDNQHETTIAWKKAIAAALQTMTLDDIIAALQHK